ncbi:ATP-binding protein [Haemophilus influenzae]|uniref:sensor histidine kinase n=1 Tax=Haemophilus influenzae TaxID=727 RepID=UPI0001A3F6CA|nr:ATP-binding protein [Haemophilus influenzae]AJO89397.1 osmolarity sensor protein [Haemophilus influenzae]AVI95511.1 histidine kinase-, DNA gyrase B-, and HSP90-like ATPase family protein [Haemophilus influenzae]AVI97284.1 histidine kinase-, DNA gyrase B-, and HSP90-like ATPase family protein [Haemophilus influenzae]AVJ06244.1 histidine kinase-, DNA gyrase B-, and HSP90-like ATPase family protein [Haemophilus influenzae]AVJ08077.1 histidine kinase-, DNA gyrase B-, and HSP90-like ATPase famil
MAKISFNVDAYTARLIGRENVSKLNGAIIELVKNTYDADATICVLYYEKTTNSLYIADNGCGMTKDVIIKHWMTIGRSTKKKQFISKSGRVQTGAKGIGRFALDRISDTCEMFTVSAEGKLIWKVDWEDFSKSDNITDVTADLYEPTLSIDGFLDEVINYEVKNIILNNLKNTGTIFRLTSLRDSWNDNVIKKIKDDLITLIPYEMKNEFQVYFFDEKSSAEDAEVLNITNAFSYDYKIRFNVLSDGDTHIEIHRNEFDFGDRFDEIITQAEFTSEDEQYFKGKCICIETNFAQMLPKRGEQLKNTIGEFSGVLYFEKVTYSKTDAERYFYKTSNNRNIKSDIFGGIKIYRDGFRVRPYGEPKTSDYDWLLIAGRKNKSPAAPSHQTGAWRVNTDQIIGSIFISRMNITLPDQSNREGIVETKEFILLKEFLINVIQEFEKDRQYVFRKLDARYDKIMEAARIQDEINKKAEEAKAAREEKKFLSDSKDFNQELQLSKISINPEEAKIVLDHKDTVIRNLEDENRLLRTLATTGIVTNTYVHEIKDITHKLSRKIVMAKEALELDSDLQAGLKYVTEANVMRESLNSWFKVTIGSVTRDKRTMKKTDLNLLISQTVKLWKETLKNVSIDLEFQGSEIQLKCFPYDIESIFSNLIANSVSSFESYFSDNKSIKIVVSDLEKEIIIKYSDSGRGLSLAYKNNPRKILEPMESDRRNEMGETIGTGMGMWIINRTVADYNGSIDLSDNSKYTSGFYATIKLIKK